MDVNKFKQLLDEQNDWPEFYSFKFVVKSDEKEQLLALLKGHKVTERQSSKGTYISITSRLLASSADEILEVYEKVKSIKGVMSL